MPVTLASRLEKDREYSPVPHPASRMLRISNEVGAQPQVPEQAGSLGLPGPVCVEVSWKGDFVIEALHALADGF